MGTLSVGQPARRAPCDQEGVAVRVPGLRRTTVNRFGADETSGEAEQ